MAECRDFRSTDSTKTQQEVSTKEQQEVVFPDNDVPVGVIEGQFGTTYGYAYMFVHTVYIYIYMLAPPKKKNYVSECWCAVGKHICSFNYVLQNCPNP